jgi:AcrR family transcriptional regulator
VTRREPAGPGAGGGRAPYVSAVRSEQARATRRAIVAAATELFVEHGYAATTIDAVAERAGVGRKTVFSSVGGKAVLLKLAWDWALVGDDEPVPMSERPAVLAMLAERDPERLVRMWVDMQLDVGARATPIAAAVLAAADVDAEARALRDTIRRESLEGATAFVMHLARVGGLRAGVTVEAAADACWALLNSLMLHLLVNTRGWSAQAYGAWLVRVVSATLLDQGPAPGGSIPPALSVVHDEERARYVASVGGRVAGSLSYQPAGMLVVLTRTDLSPGFDAHGVGDALVRRALDDVRAHGARRVVPLCHFVAWWVGRHPECADLLYDPAAD